MRHLTSRTSSVLAAHHRVAGWVGATVLACALALAPAGAGADQKAAPPGQAKKADQAVVHRDGQGEPASESHHLDDHAANREKAARQSAGADSTAHRKSAAVVTAPAGASAPSPAPSVTTSVTMARTAASAPAAAAVVRPATSRRPAARAARGVVGGTIPAVVPPAALPPTLLGPVPLIVPVIGTQGSIPSATLPWQWLILLAAVGILMVGMIVAGRRRNGEAGP